MRYVSYAVIALALIALALSVDLHVWAYGPQGYLLLGLCGVPLVLIAGHLPTRAVPRWASVVSAACLLLAAFKTTNAPFDNIMMAATVGGLLAIALAVKPPRVA